MLMRIIELHFGHTTIRRDEINFDFVTVLKFSADCERLGRNKIDFKTLQILNFTK